MTRPSEDLDLYRSNWPSWAELQKKAWIAGWALVIGLPAIWALSSIGKESEPPVPQGWVRVATLDELEEADVMYSDNSNAFVVHDPEDPIALSGESPHLGHRLFWCEFAETFMGENGEKFDRRGIYMSGPAERSMDRIALRVVKDVVQIAPSEVTTGPPAGEEEPLEPAGPFCAFPDDDEGTPETSPLP